MLRYIAGKIIVPCKSIPFYILSSFYLNGNKKAITMISLISRKQAIIPRKWTAVAETNLQCVRKVKVLYTKIWDKTSGSIS